MLAWIHQFVASEREQFAQLLAPSNQLNSPRKTMRPLAEALPEDDLDLLHQVLHTASKPRITTSHGNMVRYGRDIASPFQTGANIWI